MQELNFKTAFNYPFNRAKAMWNILWILLPFFGWFALGGYGVRIVQEFTKGKFKQLPLLNFKSDLKLGFMMFLKSIPFILVYMIVMSLLMLINPTGKTLIEILVRMFIVPILTVNFLNKQTVSSFFEIKITKFVFNNFGDYIRVLLRSLLLGIVFLIMSIVLVGIPAMAFTQNMFLADFYRRRVK